MTPTAKRAHTVARDLLSLTRSGEADRLATALVSIASSTRRKPALGEVVGRLVDTFSLAAKDRRRSLRIGEPFTLRLRDSAGRTVRPDKLDPAVAAIVRAIAASVRDDRDTCADQIGEACDNADLDQRIRVLAHCLVWTSDLLSTDTTAYPPVLSCFKVSPRHCPQ
ncbi:hypothetical protein DL990_31595 [Amycolatopsis sp. WAC 01416]|uniref:hypothetical protein n=1 Tax=Amycolatopsis sp. WAC 01416 TaxID=2203196 RepID=UPI000F789CA2|nr:hypothetical protein [Amycolatopsis sp. WAC 01416]RSN26004.1 hypothetical protein DL990_31595 [Amycolatopsis sp. WAC 01416]